MCMTGITTKEPKKYIKQYLPVGVPWFNMVSQSCSSLSQFYAAQRLGQDSGGFRSETEILPEPPGSPEQNMEILATEIVNLGVGRIWHCRRYLDVGCGEGLVVLLVVEEHFQYLIVSDGDI